jgi:hypothetical protein
MNMKQDPEVVLTFNLDGTVEKEAIGFEGKNCTEVTDFIEKALNAKDQKIRYKPEYLRQNKGNVNRIRA